MRIASNYAFLTAVFCLIFSASSAWALTQPLPDWIQRVHIGGNAAVRFMDGQSRAQLERNKGFMVYQAGIVLDVDVAKNISFWYDTDLIREGQDRSKEQIYLRWDSLFGWDLLNAKFGRTFTPFGEDYLNWNSIDNPLCSFTPAFPWALDEGALLFGDLLPEGRLSYALAVQNGNGTFNFDDNGDKSFSSKLSGKPFPWLYSSFSYLYFGKQGNESSRGQSEFWVSGFRIQPLGTTAAVGGASPGGVVTGHAFEGDVKLVFDPAEAWAGYGYMNVNDSGGSRYDRIIRWWTAQLLGYIPKTERKAYLVGRYSIVGTFSPTLGYRFAGTEFAFSGQATANPYSSFSYNQRDLYRYSFGAGYRITQDLVFKLELSLEDSNLIQPAKTPANLALEGQRNFFIAELGLRF